MPAPKGFNGWKNRYGYNPGKVEFPSMYQWINEHMRQYSLELFAEQITPWENGKANYKNMLEKPTEKQLYEIVKTMNRLLSDRAENLLKRKNEGV